MIYTKLINKFLEPKNSWHSLRPLSFTQENMSLLFHNKIPCVRIKNFLKEEDCHKLIKSAREVGHCYYEGVYPRIGKIGSTQFEYSGKNKDDYFKESKIETFKKEQINEKVCFDPIKKIINTFLVHGMNIKIAEEPGYGQYYSGLYRIFEPQSSALLHFDYAPYDAKGWSIENIDYQIAFNIYLKLPSSGGQLVVFNKPWKKNKYESFRLEGYSGSYGYDEKLIEKNEKVEIYPEVGELIFFNSRNFHCVRPGNEHRISISSFIGKIHNKNTLKIWN